jgi:hypothetical protein
MCKFTLILELSKIIFWVYFSQGINQIFIVCNDIVGAIHDLDHLRCDLVLKCLLMYF